MDFKTILDNAKAAAVAAVKGLPDNDACGFAWVEFEDRKLMAYCRKAGIGRKHWKKGWYVWNPGDYVGQSISSIEAGAEAYAKVLNDAGVEAFARSRLD